MVALYIRKTQHFSRQQLGVWQKQIYTNLTVTLKHPWLVLPTCAASLAYSSRVFCPWMFEPQMIWTEEGRNICFGWQIKGEYSSVNGQCAWVPNYHLLPSDFTLEIVALLLVLSVQIQTVTGSTHKIQRQAIVTKRTGGRAVTSLSSFFFFFFFFCLAWMVFSHLFPYLISLVDNSCHLLGSHFCI